jgi:hypothetical protein
MSFLENAGFGSRRLTAFSPKQVPISRYVSVGIEGTLEPASGRDTLRATGHFRNAQWSRDFKLVRRLGVAEVRYPIPWHRIERERGRYRWGLLERILASATQEHGLSIVADPLHHTSYPPWLEGGFLNPAFATAYAAFVDAFAERFPAVTTLTPFNEPTCTLDFCGLRGFWHPYATGEPAYVTMLRHTARAAAEAVHRFRKRHREAYILHVDTFQRHTAIDNASQNRARFLNERRFLFEELITGRVDAHHPLFDYLRKHGFSNKELFWHETHPVRIDERGGNYYPLNEEELLNGQTHHAPSRSPAGFGQLVREYAARLPYPLSLTETNIQGTVRDRISWLKYMLEEAENLQASGFNLRRFAWYPLFDCAGWNSLLQGKRWKRDPQGIFTCDEHWSRQSNEFARIYRAVSQGLRSDGIPSYAFTPRHDRTLAALKSHMPWKWIDPGAA